ncbi:hypothetical protein OUZ56_005381 [Daphnia magna]|uniref:Uncharacterized protein n=1 Tax=Daphnia magna TaxID=35525 RepID=A0ABQ9YSQ5_9CRUS|nr:hypothetical protein OUZ56_005381 [Daphnia magna]
MDGFAMVMGPKLFIVSPGVPAGNDEGGCRLSFVFYAVMERSGFCQSLINRNLEQLLGKGQISGELCVSSRRLREFP